MELRRAIEHALSGDAVLFVGAGFSIGAKNLKGKGMLSAGALSELLSTEAGLADTAPLEDAADAFLEKFGTDSLISLLRHEFTVSELASHHKDIAVPPWKCIYTTNYDNVLESAFADSRKPLFPVTTDDRIARVAKNDPLCVHLCGYAEIVKPENLFKSFKLTDTSYLSADLALSPWVARLKDDLRLAKAVFFVGYSAGDLDVRRILYESEELSSKSFFVIGESPDSNTTRRVSRFGHPILENADAFSARIRAVAESFQPEERDQLDLISVTEYLQESTQHTITDADVLDLLLKGRWDSACVSESLVTGRPFIIRRQELTDRVINQLATGSKAVAICSALGNGKTMLLERIRHEAAANGYRVFSIREPIREADSEIEQIAAIPGRVLPESVD